MIPAARTNAGRHEYDGVAQDLSPEGVRDALVRLGGGRYADAHDEATARAAEEALRVRFGELELHRVNPVWHVDNLELAGYEREYAPEPERREARLAHLSRWPDAVDAAVAALDQVPAPLATVTLDLAEGLAAHVRPEDGEIGTRALTALDRLLGHVRHAAKHGEPSAALGAAGLGRLLSSAEACEIDLDRLAAIADAERDRMRAALDEACRRIDPTAPPEKTVRMLRAQHPDVDGVLAAATALVDEAISWTEGKQLVPHVDGECFVGPMPESQRWALAGLFWAAPYETDAPSWFRITPPRPEWTPAEQQEWLASGFNAMVLPCIAIHEVAPGHFSHSRALRRLSSDVRRTVHSESFIEGWAHYCEEMALEEGFHADDARFAVGVALDALRRVTRLACSIGVHTGTMSVADAAARFSSDALISGQSALHEARRAYFDPTYGRYTWGKLVIRDLRERARAAWGPDFSLPRFHAALLDLGAPPLGLLDTALRG
jgi:hypothetical protein